MPATFASHWGRWGPLRERYEPRTDRRILSLDGGGIRGLVTLKVLVALENELRALTGGDDTYRLCDTFDLIGGTSTGAILAAGLARGMSARELLDFYRDFGRDVFASRPWYERWKSLYEDGPLRRKLQDVFGISTDLHPETLRTLLCVVVRNATTDSAWPVTSNPAAKYNDPRHPGCNLRIPLWQLVRASTAAPVYFPPEVVPVKGQEDHVFVDGGTTSYNNPAFLLSRIATEPAYRLGWDRGEQQLLLVSIGTGSKPSLGNDSSAPESNIASTVKSTLSSLMTQAAFDQDHACRTVGRCTHGPVLDREVTDLVPRDAAGDAVPLSQDLGRAFLYARYDVDLTRDGLDALGLDDVDPEAVGKLDSIDAMDDLERVGAALATQVDLAHFGDLARSPEV